MKVISSLVENTPRYAENRLEAIVKSNDFERTKNAFQSDYDRSTVVKPGGGVLGLVLRETGNGLNG